MNKTLTYLILAGSLALGGCTGIKFKKRPEIQGLYQKKLMERSIQSLAEIVKQRGEKRNLELGNIYSVLNIDVGDKVINAIYIDSNRNGEIDENDRIDLVIGNKNCGYKNKKFCRDSFIDNGLNGVDFYHTHKKINCEDCNGKVEYVSCYHVSTGEHKNEIPDANLKYKENVIKTDIVLRAQAKK